MRLLRAPSHQTEALLWKHVSNHDWDYSWESDWDQVLVNCWCLLVPVGVFALVCAVGGGRVQQAEQGSETSQE